MLTNSYEFTISIDPEEKIKVKPDYKRHTCMKTSKQEKPEYDSVIIL